MQSNGIKTARIQAQYSELNNSWAARSLPPLNDVSAVKHAVVWLRTRLRGQRRTGRHAAPGHAFPNRRASARRLHAFGDSLDDLDR
jgi:hypothetical protein